MEESSRMLSREKYDEVIRFVFRKEAEEKLGKPAGFVKAENDTGVKMKVYFEKRGKLEEDETKLQVIPYVVLKVYDGKTPKGILMYTRKGSETRLLNKASVGFGGHSNEGDEDVRETACREIKEEINLSLEPSELNFVGYIFSDKDAVSRVHIGYVYTAEINVETFENLNLSDEIKEVCLYTFDGKGCDGILENWSSIILGNKKLIEEFVR